MTKKDDLLSDLPVTGTKKATKGDRDSLKSAADAVEELKQPSKPPRQPRIPTKRQGASQEPEQPSTPLPEETSKRPDQELGTAEAQKPDTAQSTKTAENDHTEITPRDSADHTEVTPSDSEEDLTKSIPVPGKAVDVTHGPLPPDIVARRAERYKNMKRG